MLVISDRNSMIYPHLFSPIRIGSVELKNRIAHIATVTNLARANCITERQIEYYAARARGGAAMIITEGLVVHPTSLPQPAVIDLTEPSNGDALARMAEAVESHDCRLLGQLWHVGRQQLWNPVGSPWGVSHQPDALSWTVPHVMNTAEIKEIVEAFVNGAKRLQEAGFSGAELHGAHGYLITQFLSPWCNARDDEYGGDLEGRTRFLREIMAAIRAECGSGFLLGLKMPADEGVAGGIDLEEAIRITHRLAKTGQLDYIAYSQGNFSLSLENHVPDMHWQPGPFIHLHRSIMAAAPGVPVMALGKIVSAEQGERILADGAGDLIGMSRALIADPELPQKAAAGNDDAVRPCIYCNICWGEIHAGKPIACLLNTGLSAGSEVIRPIPPTPARRRVVVVGAGLAGLAAAAAAVARGHDVVLVGASADLGGKALLESRLPGHGEMSKAIAYLYRQIGGGGAIRFQLGETASAENVLGLEPDVVVLATGSHMRAPVLEDGSEGMVDLRQAVRSLLADETRRPSTAVIFDQDHTAPTYAAVELAAQRHEKVVLITPRVQIARSVPYVSAIGVYRRLYGLRVEIVLAASPVRLRNGRLVWRNTFNGETGETEGVGLAAYATPRIADDGLAGPLRAEGVEVHLVGDCYAPRNPLAAIHEGHALGQRL